MAGRKKPTGPLVGKEALTIAKLSSGSHAYVYAGQPVPSDVPDEELQRLYDEGFITEAPKVEAEPTPAATPSRSRGKGGSKTAATKPETPETPPAAAPAPAAAEGAESADAPPAPEDETPSATE